MTRAVRVLAGSIATPEDARWDEMAEELRLASLPALQKAAERWGATLTILAGLLTILTAVQAPQDLNKIAAPWKYVAGALLGAAVGCAVMAVTRAASAAQPKVVDMVVTGPSLKAASKAHSKTARDQLKASRTWATLVVPLILGSVGTSAFAPRAKDAPAHVSVVTREGEVLCGSVARGEVPGALSLRLGESNVQRPFSDVVSLRPVSNCP